MYLYLHVSVPVDLEYRYQQVHTTTPPPAVKSVLFTFSAESATSQDSAGGEEVS